MRTLSKSKLMAFRQCPKRLWLEIHRPELATVSAGAQARFAEGHTVGAIARSFYDPEGTGVLIDPVAQGHAGAMQRSQELLQAKTVAPLFEAGFSDGRVMAYADVLLPVPTKRGRKWRMVEVKSSAQVKDYHREDVAVQAYAARAAGVDIESVALAHIDSSWTYPGGGDYRGLLVEEDLTTDVAALAPEVPVWVDEAHKIAQRRTAPKIATGAQCTTPFDCGFIDHCQQGQVAAEFPVAWLPRVQTKALRSHLDEPGVQDLRDVPNDLLNERQLRVKVHTLSGQVFFDATRAAAELAQHSRPAYFLDFETVQLAVPIWKGTRPYQQIPFQFSVHRISRTGQLTHGEFLQLDGSDPSRSFAEALIAACGRKGPVFVYNAGFESSRIKELAQRFPRLRAELLLIQGRLVDLMRVAEACYYHPDQQGSWSIKKVLPTIAPDLDYGALSGVQDGTMAMQAFVEAAIDPHTTAERRSAIDAELRAYCRLDTLAMVRIWQYFSGHSKPIEVT
ncbi:DUF2779 domain-containing protein [Roseateles sp. BYS87W]|uniref:DUF2779 domain-containing protein n=1 Tax=Pelomonas baiyunensis TaxID=3299026 RepID=A0ABW7H2E7_9BURK